MSDPFDALRGHEPSVEPDADFADSLIRRVQERLDSSSSVPSYDEREDLADLEVVPVSAQHPRRVWWLSAAAAVMIVAAGIWVIAANRGDADQPPADASTTTDRPDEAAALPDEIVGRWMSGPRSAWSPTIGTSLLLETDRLVLSPPHEDQTTLLAGDLSATGPDVLEVGGSDGLGCRESVGRYTWELSESGRVLTIGLDDDSCAERSTTVPGTYWRMACVEEGDNCLGALDDGTYSSQFVTPLDPPGADWAPRFGAVTYTVPEGWANFSDWPHWFGLTTADSFAGTTPDSPIPDHELDIIARAGAVTVNGRCDDVNDPEVTTVEEMVARLRELPGLVVGDALPATVAGIEGISLDLSVDSATLQPCGSERVIPFATNGDSSFSVGDGSRSRLYLLPRPGGDGFFAVLLYTKDVADFDTFVEQATPVLDAFQFS
jgi:hypothetical protein